MDKQAFVNARAAERLAVSLNRCGKCEEVGTRRVCCGRMATGIASTTVEKAARRLQATQGGSYEDAVVTIVDAIDAHGWHWNSHDMMDWNNNEVGV